MHQPYVITSGSGGLRPEREVVHHEAASLYSDRDTISAAIVICRAYPEKVTGDRPACSYPLYEVRVPETLTPEGLQRLVQLLQEVQTRVPQFVAAGPQTWGYVGPGGTVSCQNKTQ